MRLTLIAMLLASSLSAQTNIQTTPAHHASNSGFTIGPRISNYATDVRTLTPLDTGRQSSFGVVGDYRTGVFVLDFMYDHDPENGINVSDLLIDTSAYSRDRGEATVGFAVTPFLDLQGGVRFDQMRVVVATQPLQCLGPCQQGVADVRHSGAVGLQPRRTELPGPRSMIGIQHREFRAVVKHAAVVAVGICLDCRTLREDYVMAIEITLGALGDEQPRLHASRNKAAAPTLPASSTNRHRLKVGAGAGCRVDW